MIVLFSIGDIWLFGVLSYGVLKVGFSVYFLGLCLFFKKMGIMVSVVWFGFVDIKMVKVLYKLLMILLE